MNKPKSVIIDGVEYIPKGKSKSPLVITELKAEREPYYGSKFLADFDYYMTVENVLGDSVTFAIPRGMFENLQKAVAYIDD